MFVTFGPKVTEVTDLTISSVKFLFMSYFLYYIQSPLSLSLTPQDISCSIQESTLFELVIWFYFVSPKVSLRSETYSVLSYVSGRNPLFPCEGGDSDLLLIPNHTYTPVLNSTVRLPDFTRGWRQRINSSSINIIDNVDEDLIDLIELHLGTLLRLTVDSIYRAPSFLLLENVYKPSYYQKWLFLLFLLY